MQQTNGSTERTEAPCSPAVMLFSAVSKDALIHIFTSAIDQMTVQWHHRSLCFSTGCIHTQNYVQVTHVLAALEAQYTIAVVADIKQKEIDLNMLCTHLHLYRASKPCIIKQPVLTSGLIKMKTNLFYYAHKTYCNTSCVATA